MNWKDLKLSGKFGVGFGVVLVLLAVVGVWAIIGISGIVTNASEVIGGNKLKAEMEGRIVDHLNWAEELNRYMSDKTMTKMTVQTDAHQCAFGKWYYSDARKQAEALVPELKEVFTEIEEPHTHLHESAIEINDLFVRADLELGNFLREKKTDHLAWAHSVKDVFVNTSLTTINAQMDPTQCSLGKWMYSDEVKELKRQYPELAEYLDALDKPHRELHNSAREIQKFLGNNKRTQAASFYMENTSPLASECLTRIDKILEWQDDRVAQMNVAKDVYVDKTSPSLHTVQSLLTKAVDITDENVMTDDEMLSAAVNTRTGVIIFGLLAILFGIGLAIIIAKGIINPISKGVDFARIVSEGDLTATIDVNQKDEIGLLAAALQNMVEKLSNVVAEVRSASDYVSSGSLELSSSAQELSQGASEQAAAAEEASSSMEEMSSNIQANSDNAQQTEKIAIKASQDAEASGRAVSETVQAMNEITEKISVIEEIARQTDLLALNAAIEAARAGEHGKGFAVVADGVRKLAERSQQTAAEISDIARSSVDVAQKAGEMLDQLVPDIKRTADLVQEINAASIEQTAGAEQINKAIQQLDQVIQQNASAAEEMSSTSEELAGQSEQLQSTIDFFKVNQHTTQQRMTVKAKAKVAHIKGGKNGSSSNGNGEHYSGVDINLDMSSGGDKLDKDFERF